MLITKQQVFSVCGIDLDFAKQKTLNSSRLLASMPLGKMRWLGG